MSLEKIKKRVQCERGIALVIVLTAVMALMIIVVEFAYTTRVNYSMAQNLRDRLQAEYLARSALQISLLVIKFQRQIDSVQSRVGQNVTLFGSGPLYQQIPIDSLLLRAANAQGNSDLQLNSEEQKDLTDFLNFSGDFYAKIEDEQGKININALASNQAQTNQASGQGNPNSNPTPTPPQQGDGQGQNAPLTVGQLTFEQILALIESDEYDDLFDDIINRETLIYNIMDWADEDRRRNGFEGGLEDNLYINHEPPYKAKNAKFDSIEEIAFVDGVNQGFLDKFQSSLTVYGKSNQLNINTASRTLLKGFIRKLINSRNDEEIEEIVDWIEEFRNFKNKEDFLGGLLTNFGYETADLDDALLDTLIFQSSFFSITATGTVGGSISEPDSRPITATIRAVVTEASSGNSSSAQRGRSKQAGYPGGLKFLYWRMQ